MFRQACIAVVVGLGALAWAGPLGAQVSASPEQLLINQRISQAAILRADALENVIARLDAQWIRDGQFGRAKLAPGVLTQGDGETETFAPERRNIVGVRRPPRARPGAVRLSAGQLLINQRISQAAVARSNALEELLRGRLTGGNLADGAIQERHLAREMWIGLVPDTPSPEPARPQVQPPARSGGGTVALTAAQLRINQRISQAAIRRLNNVRGALETGLVAENFADATITRAKLAPALRDPAPGLVRENAVPLGQTATVRGGWALTVLGTTPNATQTVLEENQFNDPPAPGRQFFIARVRASRGGGDSFAPSLSAQGRSGMSYGSEDSCGVIPDRLPSTAVTEGTVEGNVCWSIRSEDAVGLQMVRNGFSPATFLRLD